MTDTYQELVKTYLTRHGSPEVLNSIHLAEMKHALTVEMCFEEGIFRDAKPLLTDILQRAGYKHMQAEVEIFYYFTPFDIF